MITAAENYQQSRRHSQRRRRRQQLAIGTAKLNGDDESESTATLPPSAASSPATSKYYPRSKALHIAKTRKNYSRFDIYQKPFTIVTFSFLTDRQSFVVGGGGPASEGVKEDGGGTGAQGNGSK